MVILNSNSTKDLFCINHESDDLPLMISLSKNISKDQLETSRYQINKTTIRIRIKAKNYVGIFHLFCYLKNKKEQGTRADIIVKGKSNVFNQF